MDERIETLQRIHEGGVIAILRDVEPENLVPIAEALVDGGITALEVTADTPHAEEMIEQLGAHWTERDVAIGVGTVLDSTTARIACRAGAQFVVSPSLDEAVIRTANRSGVPVVPGVMTPSEAVQAYEAGADAIKLFPAATVGPHHLAAIRAPLDLTVIPTGGISLENASGFLEAGAAAIGVGSSLVSADLVENARWDELEKRARTYVDLVAEHRNDR